jgi:hypothetical protein
MTPSRHTSHITKSSARSFTVPDFESAARYGRHCSEPVIHRCSAITRSPARRTAAASCGVNTPRRWASAKSSSSFRCHFPVPFAVRFDDQVQSVVHCFDGVQPPDDRTLQLHVPASKFHVGVHINQSECASCGRVTARTWCSRQTARRATATSASTNSEIACRLTSFWVGSSRALRGARCRMFQ